MLISSSMPRLKGYRFPREVVFGAGLAERHEAQFVDDQQFDLGQLPLQTQQPFLITGLHQLVNQ